MQSSRYCCVCTHRPCRSTWSCYLAAQSFLAIPHRAYAALAWSTRSLRWRGWLSPRPQQRRFGVGPRAAHASSQREGRGQHARYPPFPFCPLPQIFISHAFEWETPTAWSLPGTSHSAVGDGNRCRAGGSGGLSGPPSIAAASERRVRHQNHLNYLRAASDRLARDAGCRSTDVAHIPSASCPRGRRQLNVEDDARSLMRHRL